LTRNCSPEHLRDTEFHLSAFRTREDHLTISAARRMHNKVSTMDSFAAFIACQDHLLSLAHAHIERVVLEQLVAGIDACEDESLCYRLHSLQSLYVLSVIEADRGWFLEEEIISANKSRAIRKEVNKLCRELREDAVALVDSFGIPDECLAKPGETGFV